MNRSKLGLILAGFLLAAGMGSASVLDSFGEVSGEADVEGPTFVVASDGRLILDQEFEDDGFTEATIGKNSLDYYTDDGLPKSDWYRMNLTYYLEAEVGESDAPVDVEMTLRGQDGQYTDSICTGEIEVDSTGGKEVLEDSCTGELNSDVTELELELNVVTDNGEIDYTATGDTRVEVNAQ